MNFPFYLYPNQILSGYTDYKEYLKETERLYNDLCGYKSTPNTIFQLIIGAVMEEAKDYNIPIDEHWRQLLPFYLEHYLETTLNSNVEIYIVSPNIGFKNHIEPTFIKQTSYYNWKYDKSTKTYYSTTNNIKVHIYYTPFPSIDTNNHKIVSFYQKVIGKEKIEQIIQSCQDIEFIKNFYLELNKKFESIEELNGFVLCNSYAVFRYNSINHEKYKSYGLCQDIKKLFKFKPNRILSEWTFKKDNFLMIREFEHQEINYTNLEIGTIPLFIIEDDKNKIYFIDASYI
jgi:hypothetical protein